MGRQIAEDIVRLREVANNVARLLEYGEPLTAAELEVIGSVAGTLRARLQCYRPREGVRTTST